MKITALSYINNIRIHPLLTATSIIIATVIDLGSKLFFYNHSNTVFGRVQPAFNHGISYSVGINMLLIIAVSVLCLLRITKMYIKQHINSIIFITIMSGGLGNLIDRLMYGGVRDFIYLGDTIPVFNFIFNIADIFLIVGGILLIYHYNQVNVIIQDPDSNNNLV